MIAASLARIDRLFDGGLLAPIRRMLGALVVAAGPWLVAVAAIAFVSWATEPDIGPLAAEDLRLAVIYALALAPLASAPVSTVATRRIAAGTLTRAQVGGLFVLAAGLSGAAAQVLALLVVLGLGLRDTGIGVALIFLSGAAAVMWTGFAVLTALRSFRFLIAAFCAGTLLASVLSVLIATTAPGVASLIWCFTCGVTVCAGLAGAHLSLWRTAEVDLAWAMATLRDEARLSRALAIGAGLAVLGVWIDKCVFWFGPGALRSEVGFANFPDYDSVMFLAHLSVIPSLAALMTFHDGKLRQALLGFRSVLNAGRTLGAVRQSVVHLSDTVRSGLLSILLTQLAVCVAIILLAPSLAQTIGLRLDQYLTLRIGLVGAFFHLVFLAANGLLLLCNRKRQFLMLQAGFCALNLSLSLGFLPISGTAGYAFLGCSFLAAAIAVPMALRAVAQLDYLHLVAENDGLYRRQPDQLENRTIANS